MLSRRDLGIALIGLMCLITGCGGSTPLDRVLENGAGPVDADAPEEFTTTDSGLKYRVLRKGDDERPTVRDDVSVKYAGWLENGRQFDSTYSQIEPITLPWGGVIDAWQEGLQYVGKGGMIELEVPSELGYGSAGHSTVVPPNSRLHFLIELIDIVRAPDPVEPGPADPDAPEEFTTTESGLQYRILRKGNDSKPKVSDVVTIHYRGSLMDGRVFDGTYFRGTPVDLRLDQTIEGWKEGMPLIGVGGMIELVIPSPLAYGSKGRPPRIPPNSNLQFLIELINIKTQ